MRPLQKLALKYLEALRARPRPAREADAELHARLQAHPLLEPVPARAHAAERRRRHRRHPGGAPALDRDRRRAASARSTRSSSAPASTSPTFPSASTCAAATARRSTSVWKGSPQAHLGTTVAGFPNFFFLLGPNTGLGHTSVVYMIESQIAHVLSALRYMREHEVATVEPRAEAQAAFIADVDRRLGHDGVEHRRLRELVHRQDRPQLDAVARRDVALPAARPEVRPRRVRARAARPSAAPSRARSVASRTRHPRPRACRRRRDRPRRRRRGGAVVSEVVVGSRVSRSPAGHRRPGPPLPHEAWRHGARSRDDGLTPRRGALRPGQRARPHAALRRRSSR